MEWRLYPYASANSSIDTHDKPSLHFNHGDEVFIRPKSNNEYGKRGKIIKDLHPTTQNQDDSNDRIIVELQPCPYYRKQMNLTKASDDNYNKNDISPVPYRSSFRRNRLIRRYRKTTRHNGNTKTTQPCIILVTETTNYYRHLASSQINENDHVLEIGCSNGECSLIIAKYCNQFIGFDTSTQMIQEAKEKVDNKKYKHSNHTINADRVEFYNIDPFNDPKKASNLARGSNVVFIDIGGNRDLASVLKMIQWSIMNVGNNENEPSSSSPSSLSSTLELIVIKSEELFRRLQSDIDSKKSMGSALSSVDKEIAFKKIKQERQIYLSDSTGIIENCELWFQRELENISSTTMLKTKNTRSNNIDSHEMLLVSSSSTTNGPPKYSHPLKAPMAVCPVDGHTPICRYFNYHKNGCKKSKCEFDHEHCHWCLQKGHIALHCTHGL